MKKSARALLGMVVLDLLLIIGGSWLIMQVNSGAATTAVPREQAITVITRTMSAVIGVVTGVLAVAWLYWRKREG